MMVISASICVSPSSVTPFYVFISKTIRQLLIWRLSAILCLIAIISTWMTLRTSWGRYVRELPRARETTDLVGLLMLLFLAESPILRCTSLTLPTSISLISHTVKLEFVEVARVLVAGESTRDGEVSKLWSLLETVLHSIANQLHCLFYENYEGNKDIGFHVLESDSDAASVFEVESNEMSMTETNTNTEEDRTRQSSAVDDDMPTEDGSLGFESTDLDGSSAQSFVPPPIFVRFLLDDQPVSIEDLNTIERSSSLAALVSVFKTKDGRSSTEFRKAIPSELQLPHLSAALELSSLSKFRAMSLLGHFCY